MRSKFSCFLVALVVLLVPTMVFASHLKIENAMVSELNSERKIAKVQFNVSWDNSWKNETNCDAVWVFAKFLAPNGLWKHVSLKAASAAKFDYKDYSPDLFSKGDNANLGMWVPEEKTGAFIFPTKGTGSVVSKNVELVWDYTKDGLNADQIKKTKVKVLGFEMVYVPQDKHYVGDPKGPDGPDNTLYVYPNNGSYLIKSEDPILVDKVDGALYCDQDNPRSREDTPFTIPKEFPKGFKAFWIMK